MTDNQPRTYDVLQEPQWSEAHTGYQTAVFAHREETRRLMNHREASDRLAPVIDEHLDGLKASTVGRETATNVRKAIGRIREVADGAFTQADLHRLNEDIALAGRNRRVVETITEARKAVEEAVEQAEVQITVELASQEQRLLGKVDPKREAFVRQDAEATLAGKTDVASLQKLATDPDPQVRALVASDWGLRRVKVTSKNDAEAREVHGRLREMAIDAARRDGTNPAAAEGLASIHQARKALHASREYGRMKLRGFKV